jgi:hypothetical protein
VEHQSSPKYNFQYTESKSHAYYFETSLGVIYEVKFKPSGYVFYDYPSFNDRVFEFSIVMLENPTHRKPSSDPLISVTIAAIFYDFFERLQPVIVYICDTSDAREAARNRKFNSWFENYQYTYFFKIDATLGSSQTTQTYYTSLILRLDDPMADEIVAAFRKVILDNQK